MIVRSICRARLAWMQLPHHGAQKRLCDGARAHRPQAAQPAQRLREQGIAGEAREEFRMVVVEPECEAHVVDACVALRRHDDQPVRTLHRVHALEAFVDAHRGAVRPVDDDARRVRRMPAGDAK